MIRAEEIAKKVSINKTAALVTGKGVRFESRKKFNSSHSESPLRTVPANKRETNYTGKRFGYFVVIGKYWKKKAGGKPTWVVKCSCGHYETRTSRSINNTANKKDRCHHCRETGYLRRKDEFDRTGANITDGLC